MNSYYWALFLFSITIVMYMLGFQPLAFNQIDKYSALDYNVDFISLISSYLLSWEGIFVSGTVVATLVLAGFNLIVIVPFILLSAMLNTFVFPDVLISGIPDQAAFLIRIIFNVLTYLVVISFVKGDG